MAKVSVNIEGTASEVMAALQTLVESSLGKPLVQAKQEGWSEDEISKFWGLLSIGAKEVFRVIAKRPDGCPRDDVLKELKIKGNELAGRLSSQGHVLRQFPGKSPLVVLDWRTWEYKMKAELAHFIIALSP